MLTGVIGIAVLVLFAWLGCRAVTKVGKWIEELTSIDIIILVIAAILLLSGLSI